MFVAYFRAWKKKPTENTLKATEQFNSVTQEIFLIYMWANCASASIALALKWVTFSAIFHS